MKGELRTFGKKFLAKVHPNSDKLRFLAYLPKIEKFRRKYKKDYKVFKDRFHLYDYLNAEVVPNKEIRYLEFGVFKGATIKYWGELNSNRASRFYGFDTFTGLPETWGTFTANVGKDVFDVGGKLPNITDERITFYKGLFQETLPGFLERFEPSEQLIIHNDSDLYSSTMYVLTKAHEIIVPGTIIIFDEFSSVTHEYRAFEDYVSAYQRKFEVLAITMHKRSFLSQVAIRFL